MEEEAYPAFSAAETARRHGAARALMERLDLAGLLFYGAGRAPEVYYLTEWPGSREAYLLFPRAEEPVLYVQLFNHLPNARRCSIVATEWGGPDTAQTVAQGLKGRALQRGRLGVVGPLPFQAYLRLRRELPDLELVDAAPAWRDLRTIKSPEELARMRVAAELTDRATEALATELRPGLREYHLANIVERAYADEGGVNGIHFMSTMPMDHPLTGVPAQYQSQRLIQPGDVLITEISAQYWGYTGQIHRTYFLGQEPSLAWKRLHEVAVAVFERIERVLRDGATLEEFLDAAEYVHEAGYTIYDDLLHGANQYPPILKTRRTSHSNPKAFTFRENMAVVVQPNIITPDERMGLQFGEMLLITREGTERMHRFPREYVVVGV